MSLNYVFDLELLNDFGNPMLSVTVGKIVGSVVNESINFDVLLHFLGHYGVL